jgi:hypothetical protein
MKKLMVAFRNFSNAPKHGSSLLKTHTRPLPCSSYDVLKYQSDKNMSFHVCLILLIERSNKAETAWVSIIFRLSHLNEREPSAHR